MLLFYCEVGEWDKFNKQLTIVGRAAVMIVIEEKPIW
jgi:hypothetical protein